MIWCLLAVMALMSKTFGANFTELPRRQRLDSLFGTEFEDVDAPRELRDDVFEKSKALGTRNDLRLPFGANPQTKHIETLEFFGSERYRKRYQQNLHMTWVENQDWRLDHTTNSSYNNFLLLQNPEDSYQNMNNFHRKRMTQSEGTTAFLAPLCA